MRGSPLQPRQTPSAEQIARVMAMREAGESFAEIGKLLGVAKGVIAGIVFRAGGCKPSPARVVAKGSREPKPAAVEPKPPKPEEVAVVVPRAPPPPAMALPAGALRPGRTCAWPLWTHVTPRSQRTYCGFPVFGGSYCAVHHAVARRAAA